MWTQHWTLSELRDVDRAARKIIVENGGKHPANLTSLLYLPREKGSRGMRSVEHENKITKIKSLLQLYQNSDQTVEAVWEFEEHALASGVKILFFEFLREHGLIEEVTPWYSPVMPKPAYQNTTSEAFWDIPIYTEHNEVRANRIDKRLVSHERKEVCTIEMSCPWIESRKMRKRHSSMGPWCGSWSRNTMVTGLNSTT